MKTKTILFIIILFSSVFLKAETDRQPNILIILVDDLGYNDLGCYQSRDNAIRTPNINRLAAEGMRFTDWQSANCVCGPSRAALLTGRYPPRNGYVVVSHPFDEEQFENLGLYQDEVTIPELLKPLGYRTAAIGKWHMGDHYNYMPLRHGFDHYYGRLQNFGFGKEGGIYLSDSLTADSLEYEEIHQRITGDAIHFIRSTKEDGVPFFMYLSHYLVHGPWKPNKRFASKEEWNERVKHDGDINKTVYPAMVRELDWHIGKILDELDDLGMTENTIVFFTSDNGPWLTNDTVRSAGSAWPLRGSKFNTFEGGHRVPGIVKYPGYIPPGKVSHELVSTMDIFATIADITGACLPKEKVVDGKSIWPLLTNEKDARSPHEILYAYTGKDLQTIRKGKWKLHLPRNPDGIPFYSGHLWGRGTIDDLETPMLFDLEQGVGEQTNVAEMYPEIVEELLREAEKAQKELGDWNIIGSDEHDYHGFEGNIHAIPVKTKQP